MASYIGGKNNENDNVGKNDNNYFDRKKKSGLRNGLRNKFYKRKKKEKERKEKFGGWSVLEHI